MRKKVMAWEGLAERGQEEEKKKEQKEKKRKED